MGNSHAELWGNSHAELWDFSVGHLLSGQAKFKIGKNAFIIKSEYPEDIEEWCLMKGILIKNNRIMLWKCVDANGNDFYTGKVNYLGRETICPDWEENYTSECGYALHLADSPSAARSFVSYERLKTARLLRVSVNIKDCKCYGGSPDYPMKLMASKCRFVKEYPINYDGMGK